MGHHSIETTSQAWHHMTTDSNSQRAKLKDPKSVCDKNLDTTKNASFVLGSFMSSFYPKTMLAFEIEERSCVSLRYGLTQCSLKLIMQVNYHLFIFIYCMIISFSPAYMYVHQGQKRVRDSLDLEIGILVSHHVDAGNWTQVLCKSNESY